MKLFIRWHKKCHIFICRLFNFIPASLSGFPFFMRGNSSFLIIINVLQWYVISLFQNIYSHWCNFYTLIVLLSRIVLWWWFFSCILMIDIQSPSNRLFYHVEYMGFNHSVTFIYSNCIPKSNWLALPFICSELKISLKYRFYDTSPPPCYIF